MLNRIWEAYRDVPGTMARRLANPPGEARLLMYAFVVGLVGFFASLPQTLADARAEALDGIETAGQGDISAHVLAALFGAVFLLPLFLYGFAMLVHLVARVMGGKGTAERTRHAVFWGMLLTTPLAALGTLIGGVLTLPAALWAVNLALFALFLWILAGTVMVAEDFSSRMRVTISFLMPSALFLVIIAAS